MSYEALTDIITLGRYVAFFLWAVTAAVICVQIFRKDFSRLKITILYLFNSVTFVMAWGLILKLALIVRAPIMETEQKSIEYLRTQADSSFFDFIVSTLIVTCILTVINVVYIKYFAKTSVLSHVLILFIANLIILSVASYVSTEWYFNGLSQEIHRHFS